jgi:hypothetical protein
LPGTSEQTTLDEHHLTNAGAVWFIERAEAALLAGT